MGKRAFILVVTLVILWLTAHPVEAVSTVTDALVGVNPPPAGFDSWCGFPQTSILITLTGTFNADDGDGADDFAVRLTDGRAAPILVPFGVDSTKPPLDGGRADYRFGTAVVGATTAQVALQMYHPSLNPVKIEVYEGGGFNPADTVNPGGIVGAKLFEKIFDLPCEGAGAPPDKRVEDDLVAPYIVYTDTADPNTVIEVWRNLGNPLRGEFALGITAAQVVAVPTNPSTATTIASTSDGLIRVVRLPDSQCQLIAPPGYTLLFSCPVVANQITLPPPPRTVTNVPSGAPVVVHTPGDKPDVAVEVWRLIRSNRAELGLSVSFDQLSRVSLRPSFNTAIAGMPDGSIVLYRLTTGECQVNVPRSIGIYEFIFQCPSRENQVTLSSPFGMAQTSTSAPSAIAAPSPTPLPPAVTTTQSGETYTVQRGNTLGNIAARLNTTVATLVAANAISDPSRIYAGQVLVIPGAGTTSSTSVQSTTVTTTTTTVVTTAADGTHIVQAGENLYRIGLRYGVTVEALMAANQITDPRRLRVGQRLVIP